MHLHGTAILLACRLAVNLSLTLSHGFLVRGERVQVCSITLHEHQIVALRIGEDVESDVVHAIQCDGVAAEPGEDLLGDQAIGSEKYCSPGRIAHARGRMPRVPVSEPRT